MVSIIFPAFNGWQHTRECLVSLMNLKYPKKQFEIIVIDNASMDNTDGLIKKHFPEVKLIKLIKNQGFSRAINIGIRKAKGKYLLITNNDVVFDKNYIEAQVSLAEKNDNIGIIGGIVYLKDKQNTLAFDGLRINPYLGYHQYDLNNLNNVRKIDWVSGNGLFIRRDVFKKIGLFDEEYQFYFEDIDLCIRAKKAGFIILHNPKAISYHGYGQTFKQVYKKRLKEIIYMGYKSKWRCIFKNATMLQIATSILWQFTIAILAQNMLSNVKTVGPMLRGFWWNIKHLGETLHMRKVNIHPAL